MKKDVFQHDHRKSFKSDTNQICDCHIQCMKVSLETTFRDTFISLS